MSASQCGFNANLETRVKFKNLRGKLKKEFAFETKLYSKISAWKNLKFIRRSFQILSFPVCLDTMETWRPRGSVFSPHSHKLLIEVNVIRFLNYEILKVFQNLVFKKRVQISHVSVITIATSDNNSKKMDESWTRSTFLQLNGWGENCQFFKIHCPIFTFPFNWTI